MGTTMRRMARKAIRAPEAARELGVTTREIYAMVERGELEWCKIGGKLAVWIEDD